MFNAEKIIGQVFFVIISIAATVALCSCFVLLGAGLFGLSEQVIYNVQVALYLSVAVAFFAFIIGAWICIIYNLWDSWRE